MLSVVRSPAGIRVLVDAREKLHIPWGDASNQAHGEAVMSFDTRSTQGMVEPKVFQQYIPAVRALWADSGIQHAYDRRREFQLVSNTCTRTHTHTLHAGGFLSEDCVVLYLTPLSLSFCPVSM